MNDKQLDALLQDSLNNDVDAKMNALKGIEDRVCRALETKFERPTSAPRSWFAPRLRLSLAFAGTALAMLLVGVLIGGNVGLPWTNGGNRGITFIVALPEASSVAVAGDFNDWQPVALKKGSNGVWSLELDLSPGRYEYAFVIDGVAWKPDPRADEYVKSYGFTNSVKYVGTKGETS